MATTVEMPQLGETVTEGTILSWAKQVGDSIAADEVLVEISTDKVDTEVPSPVSGTILEILVPEGETVEVGAPLVRIGEPEEGAQSAPGSAPAPAEEPLSPPEPPVELEPQIQPEPVAQAAPAASGEATTVEMPQLGETVTEGTILSWAKQVGDSIAADEVLVEISTDKVDTEVPSPVSGTILEILVPEGETVEVGAPLVRIGAAGESGQAAPPSAPEPTASESSEPAAPAAAPVPAPAAAAPAAASSGGSNGRTDTKGKLLSPVVRKLIREHDLDISGLSGTGQGGRITRKDVEALIASGGQPTAAPPTPAEAAPTPPAPAQAPAETPPAAPAAPAPERPSTPPPAPEVPAAAPRPAPQPVAATGEDEVVELDRLRARIGANMIKNKQTAAHVWASIEVDYERVERVRQAHKEAFKAEEGFSLTYLPFIARATIDALKEYPVVNSSFYLEDKKAIYHKSVNLGIAIDLNQKGLVVGGVKNADGLRLVGLAREIRALAEKARSNALEPDDITGSTFTITNPGPFGSFMTAPIINVPNTGILSTDTVAKRPSVVQGPDGSDLIAIRHIGYLGFSWDHRAFDGSTAVLFLQKIKQNIETWDWEQELA
jgi:2-oxoglutarate dehydrogenase E2 component (dihydrolipoamide succinyltransferase)